jgi:hypothetical protein
MNLKETFHKELLPQLMINWESAMYGCSKTYQGSNQYGSWRGAH